MLNKLSAFICQQALLQKGDTVICALSGGADSVALLFAMYLLQDKLGIRLEAAHYNHGLRGAESDADRSFAEELCSRYEIPLHLGQGNVKAGKKGLEAAAREARYRFLEGLNGVIATAHTADDNAETLLMHLIRGTGLKGLGGICPKRGRIIRPMLTVTRREVLAFLEEYGLSYRDDSSNAADIFLRNRLRHHVMPLLRAENPRLAEAMSETALRLRQDNELLEEMTRGQLPPVGQLRAMAPSLRRRYLTDFLERSGVKEPEAEHIILAEKLVFSPKPSARADFPGNIVIFRNYDRLEKQAEKAALIPRVLACPGSAELPDIGLMVRCEYADKPVLRYETFTVYPSGTVYLRCRQPGDTIRLHGGTRSLKQLFVDRKIPAHLRCTIPVVADDRGVLGVYGFGANLDRIGGTGTAVQIHFEKQKQEEQHGANDKADPDL